MAKFLSIIAFPRFAKKLRIGPSDQLRRSKINMQVARHAGLLAVL
jgi:hypothetical protein